MGPIVGGFVSEEIGWRWTFWIILILVSRAQSLPFPSPLTLSDPGISILHYIDPLLHETNASVLLSRKAARLRKETNNPALISKMDRGLPPRKLFLRAILGLQNSSCSPQSYYCFLSCAPSSSASSSCSSPPSPQSSNSNTASPPASPASPIWRRNRHGVFPRSLRLPSATDCTSRSEIRLHPRDASSPWHGSCPPCRRHLLVRLGG